MKDVEREVIDIFKRIFEQRSGVIPDICVK